MCIVAGPPDVGFKGCFKRAYMAIGQPEKPASEEVIQPLQVQPNSARRAAE
tara:strand:+ start:216 stop:368 length:153 start_codon:yes stop_codon:yes gene_type:complete